MAQHNDLAVFANRGNVFETVYQADRPAINGQIHLQQGSGKDRLPEQCGNRADEKGCQEKSLMNQGESFQCSLPEEYRFVLWSSCKVYAVSLPIIKP